MKNINLSQLKIIAEKSSAKLKQIAKDNGRPVRIYLHWSAGHYGHFFSDYHINVDHNGKFYVSTEDFSQVKNHTWQRNSGAIGIALACAYNATTNNLGNEPPTVAQIDTTAQVLAVLASVLGVPVTENYIMAHAEAAAKDGYGAGSGDPETRWDLWFLKNGDVKGTGGQKIRDMALDYQNSGKLAWLLG